MPAIRRTLKNVVKNYSDAQVKVREATSNDPWGPSSTLMSEIADLTYNVVAFTEIMQMVWKRLNDDGKNWRHVYKSLVVLDYIIKTGSEKVAQQCKENFHAIKTLTSFQHIDADNKDSGMNVREKAKQLVAMLSDDERLKNERAKALKAKERFAQNAMGVGNGHSTGPRVQMRHAGSPSYQEQGYPDSSPGSVSAGSPSEIECARPSSAGEEELQLQLAMVLSKEEHEEAMRKQKSDDIKLQMAIEQSKEHAKSSVHGGTLLDLAGPSSAGAHNSSTAAPDPWGIPVAPPASTDPWGSPLPPPQSASSAAARTTSPPAPDPWGANAGGASGGAAPTDPWGMPVSKPVTPASDPWGAPVSQNGTGGWSGTSPTLAQPASAWDSSGGVDAFGMPTTNGASSSAGASNNIDSEFDLLSARSTETSPTKSSAQGLEEFDLLAGGSKSNGANDGAFAMGGLEGGLPAAGSGAGSTGGKKKSAEEFLGGHANLINLDQLVSKTPPPGNNPFAMTTGNNPFHDPNAQAAQRMPLAQLAANSSGPPPPMVNHMAPAQQPGFNAQPVSSGLLPAPLLPLGPQQPQQFAQPQAQANSYNPFL